jgi:hypothetical protein
MYTSLGSESRSQNLGLQGKQLLFRQPPADCPTTQAPGRARSWHNTFSSGKAHTSALGEPAGSAVTQHRWDTPPVVVAASLPLPRVAVSLLQSPGKDK